MEDFIDFSQYYRKMDLKVYHDGSHYVGSEIIKIQRRKVKTYSFDKKDIYFNELYAITLKELMKPKETLEYIRQAMTIKFPFCIDIEEYISIKVNAKLNTIYQRKKRFKRKAYLNDWNYSVTFTYDSNKHTEEDFKKSIRRCLSNLHSRRGWLTMGVFERAPDTDRLHYHGLVYIPNGQMVGKLFEVEDYDKRAHKMRITIQNTFFCKKFGRCDFQSIEKRTLQLTGLLDYLLKYIAKSGERIVYSRGIPSFIVMKLGSDELVCDFEDYVTKYVLFEDIIDWKRDIYSVIREKRLKIQYLKLKLYEPIQISMFDNAS